MSELTTDLDWWAVTRYPSTDDDWSPSAGGRHAYDEDAALTPIFHALTSGGRRRQPEAAAAPARTSAPAHPGLPARSAAPVRPSRRRSAPDPVDAFRRDPLTMPIPEQAGEYVAAARRAAFGVHELRAEREPARGDGPGVSDTGRHHRVRSSISSLF